MSISPIGVINLECLMSRANILFTNGYHFRGSLDPGHLEASFIAVVECMEKFEHRLDFETQDKFQWIPDKTYSKRFHIIDSDDIDNEFRELCRNSLSLLDEGQHCPMVLTVIRDRHQAGEFIIAQTSEHSYVDARSSEVLFNRIIDHYNALCRKDTARLVSIIQAVKKLRTASSADMIEILGAEGHDAETNIQDLSAYPVADIGEYVIPLQDVPGCLEQYKLQRFAPVVKFFDIRQLTERCRNKYPNVTQNSVICAALAKGFYELNHKTKGKPEQHTISFKMLSDLLSPELRQEYSGNYIAFVPVSVDGERPLEEIAQQINERIRHFKTSKLDLSLFQAVEDAVDAALVGTIDDPLSFVVTNWNNYQFLDTEEFLHGCTSLRHQSGVNIEPKDTLGAVLVNRPILVVNLSPNDELCLSFFPSLRSEAETIEVADSISEVIHNA